MAVPVPGSSVPVTGQTFAVLLTTAALGPACGLASQALYLVLGVVGLPVFAGAGHGLPMPLYATFQFDRVLAGDEDIGRTAFTGYSANERAVLALAMVDSAYAEPGTEVTVLWGESPNTAKPTAEPHVQVAAPLL